jgi:hypothetical protein
MPKFLCFGEAMRRQNPLPRMQMLDGFNEGWIEFESGEAGCAKGQCKPGLRSSRLNTTKMVLIEYFIIRFQ